MTEPVPEVAPEPAPAEKKSKAEYQRGRRALAVTLYFESVEAKEELQAAAKEAGYFHNFNAFLLLKIRHGLSGEAYPPGFVGQLKEERDKLRTRLEAALDEAEAYRQQVRALQQQRDALLALVARLPFKKIAESAPPES